MNRRITRVLVLVAALCSSHLRANGSCKALLAQAAVWGVTFDDTLEIVPVVGEAKGPVEIWTGKRFPDLNIRIHEDRIPAMAQRLSMDGPNQVAIETQLRSELQQGHELVSLKKFLPERAQSEIGICSGSECYETALRFHSASYKYSDQFVGYIRSNYTTLGKGTAVQYGDLVMFWRMPTPMGVPSYHAAIYLGRDTQGMDYLYHKLAPASVFQPEFNSFANLMPEMGRQAAMPFVMIGAPLSTKESPFQMEFLRFDPKHTLPAQIPPLGNPAFGSPIHQRYVRETLPEYVAQYGQLPATITPEMAQAAGVSLPAAGGPRGEVLRYLPRPQVPTPLPTPEARRDTQKDRKNAPCPCGSGKKYKNCHGAR